MDVDFDSAGTCKRPPCEGYEESEFALKRARTAFGDPSSAAAAVVASSSAAAPLESCFARAVRWLSRLCVRGEALPRTAPALERALTPLCRGWVAVDAHIVLFHLLLNGILVDCGPPQHLLPNPRADLAALRARGFLACSAAGVSAPFSSDFVDAFWKAAAWVSQTRALPSAPAALGRCLAQVCVVRRDVAPADVAAALCERGVLCSDERDGTLHYNTPLLLLLGRDVAADSSATPAAATAETAPHFVGVPLEDCNA